MAITSIDDLVDAMNRSETVNINKASQSNVSAGFPHSMWTIGSIPAAGGNPTGAVVTTKATTGALRNFTSPGGGQNVYLARMFMLSAITGADVQIHDRLAHMGGLSGVTASPTTQTVDVTAAAAGLETRIGASDYSDLSWWLEIYLDVGTSARNVTVNYTDSADASQSVVVPKFGATTSSQSRRARLHPIAPIGLPIKSVQTVVLDATTGTVGNWGVTCSRPLTSMSLGLANASEVADWAQLGLPVVTDNACLWIVMYPGGTTTGALAGTMKLVRG